MIIDLEESNCSYGSKNILIRDGQKLLKLFYGANGDLYLDMFGDRNIGENGNYIASFSINKDEGVYSYFDELISNIVYCNVYDLSDVELKLGSSFKQLEHEISNIRKENHDLMAKQCYEKLVQNNTIIWYSDNIYDEKANKLEIFKEEDRIRLTFTDNPNDSIFGFGVRICNSGSKYDPFNLCFMKLFNQLLASQKNKVKKL